MLIDRTKEYSVFIETIKTFSVDRLVEINEPVSDDTMKTIYEQLKERMHKK